jgi:hypothetical protein
MSDKRNLKMKHGKVEKVMREFKHGTLHSGSKSGPKVKSRKQAIAIAMSEAGLSRKNPSPPHGKNGRFPASGAIGIP